MTTIWSWGRGLSKSGRDGAKTAKGRGPLGIVRGLGGIRGWPNIIIEFTRPTAGGGDSTPGNNVCLEWAGDQYGEIVYDTYWVNGFDGGCDETLNGGGRFLNMRESYPASIQVLKYEQPAYRSKIVERGVCKVQKRRGLEIVL